MINNHPCWICAWRLTPCIYKWQSLPNTPLAFDLQSGVIPSDPNPAFQPYLSNLSIHCKNWVYTYFGPVPGNIAFPIYTGSAAKVPRQELYTTAPDLVHSPWEWPVSQRKFTVIFFTVLTVRYNDQGFMDVTLEADLGCAVGDINGTRA